ncbi:MAG: beta-propeller fold lactonase family protein, partial [Flavobacteriales bacterium]|nr:beta-propeller fold lactonase family protein [Flavobacteriales bacterium]
MKKKPALFTALAVVLVLLLGNLRSIAQDTCSLSPPAAFFIGLSPSYCGIDPPVTLTGFPSGGTFSGPGISGNQFTSVTAGAGTHDILYTYSGYGTDTSLAYAPLAGSGTSVPLVDDSVSGALPIGFNFDFFGITYDSLYISSNGFITFSPDFDHGCCAGDFIPSSFTPNNLIAFAWEDLNPALGGTIEYFTTGSIPNRILVVNFTDIAHFGGADSVTTQILLYETSNIIEIHTTAMTAGGDIHTMGLENIDGTGGNPMPGRNSSVWSASLEMVRFTPNLCTYVDTQTTIVTISPAALLISDTCFNMGSIGEGGTLVDTLWVYNTGCDTLFVTGITNATPEFSASPTSFSIMPGDSVQVNIAFSPLSAGVYNDTLNITTNDVDTSVCLSGIGTAAPNISFSVSSLSTTISSCDDSITLPITIYNTGSVNLNYEVSEIFPLDFAYITNYFDNTVSVLDLNTNTIVGAPIPVGFNPWRTTIKPDGSEVYVSNRFSNTISVIRTSDNTVVATIFVGSQPTELAFTPDGNFAYVGNQGSDNVMKIDCNTYSVISTIVSTGNFNNPKDIVITADGKFAYVGTDGDGVSVIDIASDNVILQIPGMFSNIHSLAITPDGKFIYASEGTFGSLVNVIEVSTNTVFASIGGFDRPHSLDITPDGNYVYVADMGDNEIEVIDVATNTIFTTISEPLLSFSAWGLAVSRDGNFAYVTIAGASPTMVIVNTSTNTVVGSQTLPGTNSKGMATIKGGVSWLAEDTVTGTIVPGDSAIMNVTFYSSGLNSGIYTQTLYITSNDSSPMVNTIPCTLTVDGVPLLALSDTCLDLDTIMEFTTTQSIFTIYNTGCDTLFITDANNTLPEFSLSDTSAFVLPFDSVQITVTFSPLNSGTYNDTVLLFSNDVDTAVCLVGVALESPLIATYPDSFNITLTACDDSILDSLKIYNTGTADLNFSFDLPTSYAYVCNRDADNVSVIDMSTNTIVGGPITAGNGPWRAAMRPNSEHVYVSNRFSNDVTIIQTSDNTVVATIPVGSRPHGITFTPDSRFAYVCNRLSSSISKIDCNTMAVIATLTSSLNNPQDVAITPDGQFMYVANRNNGVTVYDMASDLVVATIPALTLLEHSIEISGDGKFVYVSRSANDDLIVISTATNTVVATITGFDQAHEMDITPDGNFLYVANKNANNVIVVDLNTNTISTTITSGLFSNPWGLAIEGNFAYIANSGCCDGLAIIDITTNTVIGNLPLPNSDAYGIAILERPFEFWTVTPDTGGTIPPGDSIVLNVLVSGVGLNSGSYQGDLLIYSNDPFTPVDTVPLTLTITGAPQLDLSASCLDLDTIMEFTTAQDSFLIYNPGCDTLFITDANNNLPEFTLSDTAGIVLPRDSAWLVVTFAPLNSGTYLDTIRIFSNDVDTSVCLVGVALESPTISTAPDSILVTLTNCDDSLLVPLKIYNTGTADLIFNLGPTFDYAYVTNRNSDNVSVIDLNTNTIFGGPIPVGNGPWRACIRPNAEHVYVSNRFSNDVSVIQTSDNTVVATIPVGNRPTGIAFTPDSRFAYVGNRTDDNVMKIDCNTMMVISTLTTSLDDPQDIVISRDG